MAWRKRYSDIHSYNEYVTRAEEQSFLDNYQHQMIQLDPKKTILVICHTDNTVDKTALRETHMSSIQKSKEKMRETKYKLEDFVKEHSICSFYST
jgi:hypothetical protein